MSKTIILEIEEELAELVSITACKHTEQEVNMVTYCFDLEKGSKIHIHRNGYKQEET